MKPASVAEAAAPLLAALLAVALAAATGFDQRAALAPWAESRFYGFFLDRYPLYAAALVYGLARILAAACAPGPAGPARRFAFALLGVAALLALSLHPTFGGAILRSGFMTGGIAFLQGLPLWLAYALGAAAVAFSYGCAVGIPAALSGNPLRPRRGWRRGLVSGSAGLVQRYLALWFAFAVLGLAREAGIGPWPKRPLTIPEFGIGAGLVLIALLPHSVIVARRAHTNFIKALIKGPRSRYSLA
ncbi:hypothetical protein [Methylobacterium nigriterrae]|uniref:hypothetical protein n=1 Tax=Methylobacterium nigriterrae TaxID=3127512 RepID=UPI0030134B45